MLILDYLKKFKDDDIVAIGARTGYIYIGTARAFEESIKQLDEHEKDRIRSSAIYVKSKTDVERRKRQLENLRDMVKAAGLETIPNSQILKQQLKAITESYKVEAVKRLDVAKENFKEIQKILKSYRSFKKRDVISSKKIKTLMPDEPEFTQIIIEGQEEGRFWTKEEYDTRNDPKKKKAGDDDDKDDWGDSEAGDSAGCVGGGAEDVGDA